MSAEIALLQLVLTPQNGATVVRGQRPGFDPDDEFPAISRFGVAILRFFSSGGHFLPECSVAKVGSH